MFILEINCNNQALGNILGIVKNILTLIQILGPILCIISLIVLFIKIMNNPEDKKLKKGIQNSIISLVLLFFIPLLVDVVMNLLGNNNTISSCWKNATINHKESTYQPIGEEKRKKIYEKPENYEKGEQQSSTPSSANVEKLLSAAKKVTDYVRVNQFRYGDAPINPAMNHDAKLVSCDRCVAWFLYEIGYTDQPESHGLVVYDGSGTRDLSTYLQKHGFKKITNYSEIKAGDIMFVNPSSSGHPGHTFLLGNKVGNGIWERYDCGSGDRIRCTGNYASYSQQPFKEPVSNFLYAYRLPNA